MFASTIIPTHNRKPWVIRAVDALLKQDYPADSYEIIVCCDRCTDGTQEALAKSFPDPRLRIMGSKAPGQAGALNTALEQARGEVAIFLDDEVEAAPGLVSAYVHTHKAKARGRAALVGYSRVKLDAEATPVARQLAQEYERFFQELDREGRRSTPVDLCGSNFSISVAGLREAGGFHSYGRNDFELAVRLLKMGYEFFFCREASASMHLAQTGTRLVHRAEEWAENDCRLAREYPWCVPHLPFFGILQEPQSRRKWRLLWLLGRSATAVLAALRKLSPENLRLVNWEYGARYCLAVRAEFPNWDELCQLCRIH